MKHFNEYTWMIVAEDAQAAGKKGRGGWQRTREALSGAAALDPTASLTLPPVAELPPVTAAVATSEKPTRKVTLVNQLRARFTSLEYSQGINSMFSFNLVNFGNFWKRD